VIGGAFSGKIRAVIAHDEAPHGAGEATGAAGSETVRPSDAAPALPAPREPRPREVGGRDGPEPTRFGDWELRGRCIDF
jgi:hypothetical protein